MGADESHPKGYWEPLDALRMNDDFLFQHGTTYFDPSMYLEEEVSFKESEREKYVGQIGAFLCGCPTATVIVIKEPRITALFAFWSEAARRNSFSIKAVIATRHPGEVSASEARYGIAAELAAAMWLKHSLLAERHSRDIPRLVVEYSNLMRNWRVEVARISKSLSVDLRACNEIAVDGFLSRDLYRMKCSDPVSDIFGCRWTPRAYAILSEAAKDRSIDADAMDEIYRSYAACARTFRVSVDEYRSKFDARLVREGTSNVDPPRWELGRDF